MRGVYIVDTTLRDGEQAPGVSFAQNEKVEIAKKLDSFGVDVIEVGIPAMGKAEQELIKKVIDLDLNAEIITWNRLRTSDIKATLSCGSKNLHLSVPVSDTQIYQKLGKGKQWVLEEVKNVIDFCQKKDCEIVIGSEDASRAEDEFLFKFYDLLQNYGIKRVRYADTLGILDPKSVYREINKITNSFEFDIDFHGHNDFGMATANAFSAWQAGADYISCTVNGIGERAGNTALEEIIVALKYIEELEVGFDLKEIVSLSKLVETASEIKLNKNKAIVGENVFTHESGIHVDGLLKDVKNYQSFSPKDLGREQKISIGKSSGTNSVIYKLEEIGVEVNQKQAEIIVEMLRGV